MDQGLATFFAAILAALFSGISFFQQKKKEIRTANRKYLESFIEDLSGSIHQLIALSIIMTNNKSSESLTNTKDKAEEPKKKLKELRIKIKYPLWGIDDAIQKITRIPDYTAYTLSDKNIANKNIKMAKKLVKSVDRCIKNCYLHGRNPNFLEIIYIKIRVKMFTRIRDNFKESKK